MRIILAAVLVWLALLAPARSASVTTAYVDCQSGLDSNAGQSVTAAWQTLQRATTAILQAGDSLLLKRGCIWEGPVQFAWSGVTIGAYGAAADPLPLVQLSTANKATQVVTVSGSNNTIDSLAVRADPPAVVATPDPNSGNSMLDQSIRATGCPGTGYGIPGVYARNGFVLTGSGNTLQNSQATQLVDGVLVNGNANKILHNEIYGINQDGALTLGSSDDYGAQAIELNSSDNEVAFNNLHDNIVCSYDYGRDGSQVTLWAGTSYHVDRNQIHDNTGVNSVNFTELGSAGGTLDSNIFERNSSTGGSFFVLGVGTGSNTRLSYNTITSTNGGAVSCAVGCATLLSGGVDHNSINTVAAQIYANGAFPRSANSLWSPTGPGGICVSVDTKTCLANIGPDSIVNPAAPTLGPTVTLVPTVQVPTATATLPSTPGATSTPTLVPTVTRTPTPKPINTPTPARSPTATPTSTPTCAAFVSLGGQTTLVRKPLAFCQP